MPSLAHYQTALSYSTRLNIEPAFIDVLGRELLNVKLVTLDSFHDFLNILSRPYQLKLQVSTISIILDSKVLLEKEAFPDLRNTTQKLLIDLISAARYAEKATHESVRGLIRIFNKLINSDDYQLEHSPCLAVTLDLMNCMDRFPGLDVSESDLFKALDRFTKDCMGTKHLYDYYEREELFDLADMLTRYNSVPLACELLTRLLDQ